MPCAGLYLDAPGIALPEEDAFGDFSFVVENQAQGITRQEDE
jgi:hypothetical protein